MSCGRLSVSLESLKLRSCKELPLRVSLVLVFVMMVSCGLCFMLICIFGMYFY